ncbi:ABC transporter substrate-binding protein [Acidimangrovimonas sediminis]|uniref:ABC transporter substrate-binding protein n=1 Tax=Acidimangrovimonas sediminis TaxID=2056283 RepID=UPI000C802B56|nr:ABC transporter substrate-binding protein [Acidimangrovimonas sediminis]
MKTALLTTAFLGLIAGAAQAADLPADIASSKTLHLTVNGTYAPFEYVDPDTNKLKGLDIDLANAIADKLGLKIEWTNTAFAQLIPSLDTGRSDFVISGFSDRESRRKTLDFVDYLESGPQFMVMAKSDIKSPEELCGKKVSTTRSTSYPAEIAAWSKANCEAKGKPAIEYVPAENSIYARQAMQQGRVDAVVQGSTTVPYVMQQTPDTFRGIGKAFSIGYYGIAFPKKSTQLREVVTEALDGLIKDGTYGKILTKYGLQDSAVAKPMLNAATQ